MKKIFTLLFAVAIFAAANAQNGDNRRQGQWNNQQNDQWNNRNDNGYGRDGRYNNGRNGMERRRDMEIARINRDYDFRMQRVRSNYFMNRYEKMRQLRNLQDMRDREVRKVYHQYGNNGRNNDRRDRNDRRYDHN